MHNKGDGWIRDSFGRTILHCECKNGLLSTIAEYIFSKGANIHARDYEDWKLLHYDAKYCNTEILKFLVSKGSYDNAQNKGCKTKRFSYEI